MKILLSSKEKLMIFTPLLSFLLIYTSIVVVAQYGTTPLSQLATQDPLEVGDIQMLSNGEYQFQLIQNNQSNGILINTREQVTKGEPIVILNLQDATSIPFIYEAREWQNVYTQDDIILSGENNFLTYFAGALWIIPLGGVAVMKFKGSFRK